MTVTYSLELIRALGDDLRTVADVMDGRHAAADYDAADVGPQVAEALDHFRGNWDDKRELLTTQLRGVADMTANTADTFEQLDVEKAAQVREILEGGA